ncbi:DUF1643 domain-containing protein [Rhizobacter sp. Root404]|uniref:DUF1643 domain-containing protein n=1 Tax=Rhizobacter sp. Root404 TaxID=1736528 RepID=UPI00138F8C03|nr:DUF1643 domain-containing protein [Rhizobacter sp. Root404]
MTESFLDMGQRELGPYFDVSGRFYAIEGRFSRYLCRDLLEIRRRRPDVALECDAVFIMMNPGSSEPVVEVEPVELRRAAIVATKPDITQYQLMRLMGVLDWSFIKVLNLSDLRERKSALFYKRFRAFEKQEEQDGHSIFSRNRRADLEAGLTRKSGAPVVLAWGVNPALRGLAKSALLGLNPSVALGLLHDNGEWAYRHPLPRNRAAQRLWRREALEMLQAKCGPLV